MIVDRIKQIIDYKNISVRKFCIEIGVANGFLDKVKDVGSEKASKILYTFPEINPEWLITGKGDMLRKIPENVGIQEPRPTYMIKKGIPLVRLEVAAGFGSDDFAITEQDIEASYVVPDFNGIDFMIRVKGSSMYPKYSSGDIIACRKLHDSKFIQWNKCHVIATREQGLLVKRLKKGSTEKCILAISDNKEYDPFEIPLDEVTGIALVIGVIRLE